MRRGCRALDFKLAAFQLNQLDFAPDASLDVSQLAGGVSQQRFRSLAAGQELDLPKSQGHGHLCLNQGKSHANAGAGSLKFVIVIYRIVLYTAFRG